MISAGLVDFLWRSTPPARDYVLAMDDLVRNHRFKTIAGRPALVLDLHGSACGKAGSAAWGGTLYWKGERFGPAHRGGTSHDQESSQDTQATIMDAIPRCPQVFRRSRHI